jgi:lysophospholipase L1-like esterase
MAVPSRSEAPAGYLALGDSLTAGFQAGRGEDKAGGYVGAVLEAWRHRHPDAQLTNLACFGDDTTAMLTGNGSTCSYPQGSQLAAALASLRQGAGIGLVTITIGVNDIYGCTVVGIDGTCLAYVTRTMGAALKSMLAQIRAAAPAALIVALTYYNPLLATSFGTPEAPSTVAPRAADPQVAIDSAQAFAGLNRVITTAVTAVGGRVADVAGAFAVTDTSGSPVPVNIQRLCDWTSFCTVGDAHPNDAGYAAMARAVTAEL